MVRYYVHYSKGTDRGLFHGIRMVSARNEQEAMDRVRHAIPGSFGHWVNRLANEEL